MKLMVVSLGCDKNLVDTERMLGMLSGEGYTMTNEEAQADIIVINTCCFIGDAKEESINTILEMAEYKKAGTCKVLIVAGCLAQRYKEEIVEEIEEVDAVTGTTAFDKIAEAVREALDGQHLLEFADLDALPALSQKRLLTTGGHYAFLKIAEGCDKCCTYCIIPKVRGHYRSVPMERLVEEAGELAAQGVKELILVAQETTLYGVDLYQQKMLPELLRQLCKVDGLQWIRLQYCYPEEITEELIQVIKGEEKICHYLDIPIQHANNRILKRMGRKTTKEQLMEMITRLRSEIPDIALRTTLISGFPSETEEEHEELIRFVEAMKFERLGVFAYSPEEDTPAALMEDQIEEEVKEQRRDEVMEVQQDVAFACAQNMVDRVLKVFIEGKLEEEHAYVGRTYMDAPGVDGYIFIHAEEELMTGDIITARVLGAMEYDVIGEMIDESAE